MPHLTVPSVSGEPQQVVPLRDVLAITYVSVRSSGTLHRTLLLPTFSFQPAFSKPDKGTNLESMFLRVWPRFIFLIPLFFCVRDVNSSTPVPDPVSFTVSYSVE